MTLTKALETMATVLPVEVVELIRGYFLALDTDTKINAIYDAHFPHWSKKGEINGLYKADKMNENFSNIQEHLWNRACHSLNNWLYDMYCESIGAYDDEE